MQEHHDALFWYENDENKLIEPQVMFDKNGLELHITCGAWPEQYEVFLKNTETQVGYLRLRHGTFRVDYPDCGGETIYSTEDCDGDGSFEDNERMKFLREAMNVILKKLNNDTTDAVSDTTKLPKEQNLH